MRERIEWYDRKKKRDEQRIDVAEPAEYSWCCATPRKYRKASLPAGCSDFTTTANIHAAFDKSAREILTK